MSMIVCWQKEVKSLKNTKKLVAKVVKAAAMAAIKRDANSTTCFAIFQPKVPANLSQFKNHKK